VDLRELIESERPDVAHFHNTFPLISPAAYYACNSLGVPVVQTVQRYLALTQFVRDMLIRGGFPAQRITVKPNFIARPPSYRELLGEYAIYVGRLSDEKGILCLLDAWRQVPELPLRLVGDGPLRAEVETRASALPNVRLMGRLARSEVFAQLQNARMLVFPSQCYEGLGNSLLEAFAMGVPVVASALGAPLEVLERGNLGSLFQAGNPDSLTQAVKRALDSEPELRAKARAARSAFDARYRAESCYAALLQAYREAAQQLAHDT
jgi:glycosyltransferase involved in cell wall biosynthesis